MSNRMIVSIEPGVDDTARIRLIKAPGNIQDALIPYPFEFNPEQISQWGQQDAVKTHGKTILSMLKNAHPAVKTALDTALQIPHGEAHSIYFQIIHNADAERLYWETLYDGQTRFMSLDNRWPIARVADSEVDIPNTIHDLNRPLKIMAFISALGINGEPEWETLYKAAEKSRKGGLPVLLNVFVGEGELFNKIQNGLQSQGITDVIVKPIPDRLSDIEKALNDFAPQIVHFFCHGSASHGVAELEFATILDNVQDQETGSIRLDVNNLANMLKNNDVWLVTLNCCEGARATGDLQSMAHTLVANGIPAALGSLEPIDALDAHQFCESFYTSLFEHIQKLLPQVDAGDEVELEWAKALRSSRMGISQRHDNDPQNSRQWALPVLYVRPEQFQLRKHDANSIDRDVLKVMKLKAETVAAALRALPLDTPDGVRQGILTVLEGYPAELKPDMYGNFISGDI